jgi:hypothetical protein
MSEDERALVFVGVWVALTAVLGGLFWKGSFQAKRKWFPRLTILAGLLFIALVYWATRIPQSLYLTVPATGIIVFLNLALVKFCPKCSAYNPFWDRPSNVRYCAYCGFRLSQGGLSNETAPPNNALEQTRDE